MFHLLLNSLLLSSPVQAMTPPTGWVALGDGHAVRETGKPEKGELIELSVKSDIVSLGFALMDSNINVQDSKTRKDGGDIGFEDGRIGQARYLSEKWIVCCMVSTKPSKQTLSTLPFIL